MRSFRFIFFICGWCLTFFSCNSSKESVVGLDSECLPKIDQFFDLIRQRKSGDALKTLLQSNSDIDLQDSATIDLQIKFKRINDLSGKYLGYTILKKRGIERDVAIYSCFVKYQRKFYRFVFIFYKADANAIIYKFLFDDVIDVELEESLKLYVQ